MILIEILTCLTGPHVSSHVGPHAARSFNKIAIFVCCLSLPNDVYDSIVKAIYVNANSVSEHEHFEYFQSKYFFHNNTIYSCSEYLFVSTFWLIMSPIWGAILLISLLRTSTSSSSFHRVRMLMLTLLFWLLCYFLLFFIFAFLCVSVSHLFILFHIFPSTFVSRLCVCVCVCLLSFIKQAKWNVKNVRRLKCLV